MPWTRTDWVCIQTLAGGVPQTIRSRSRYRTITFDAIMPDDTYSTATQKRAELVALDEADTIVCYRDNTGRKWFAKIVDLTFTDQIPDWWRASVSLREETYTEAVD